MFEQVPSNVIALQDSIKAILVGKTTFPDWFNTGLPDGALLQSFPVQMKTTGIYPCYYCLSLLKCNELD